jgi:hypothetical protein
VAGKSTLTGKKYAHLKAYTFRRENIGDSYILPSEGGVETKKSPLSGKKGAPLYSPLQGVRF